MQKKAEKMLQGEYNQIKNDFLEGCNSTTDRPQSVPDTWNDLLYILNVANRASVDGHSDNVDLIKTPRVGQKRMSLPTHTHWAQPCPHLHQQCHWGLTNR